MRRFRKMPLPFSKYPGQRDRGQITVFLSLVFLVMTGLIFCVLEGIREYEISALAEDAMEGAGKEVLANYDRSLFLRYDLFFLDPREKTRIVEDGKDYINRYFTEGEFFGMNCKTIRLDQCVSVTDQSAAPLREEIREWVRIRDKMSKEDSTGPEESGYHADRMRRINKAFSQRYSEISQYISGIHEVSGAEILERQEMPVSPDSAESEDIIPPIITGIREVNAWKEIRDTLEGINIEESLYTMAAAGADISGLMMDTSQCPSGNISRRSASGDEEPLESLRCDSIRSLTDYFPSAQVREFQDTDQEVLGLMTYINNHFYRYGIEDSRKKPDSDRKKRHSGSVQTNETVLHYEEEYLVNGQPDDESNLKCIMRRIFRWRFLMNYDYACSADAVTKKAERIAESLAGQEGFYSNEKAGRIFLAGAAAYGQTLTDMSILLKGGSVPLIPNHGSWQADLYHFSECMEHFGEKRVEGGEMFYEDYLNLFLYEKGREPLILFRMMDIMQSNVRLSEQDFVMKEALYSFRWKGVISSRKWFPSIAGFRLNSPDTARLAFQKVYSY